MVASRLHMYNFYVQKDARCFITIQLLIIIVFGRILRIWNNERYLWSIYPKIKCVIILFINLLLIFSPLDTAKGLSLFDCDTIHTADFYKMNIAFSNSYNQELLDSLEIDQLIFDTTSSFIICSNQTIQYSANDIIRLFQLGRAYFENSEIDKAKRIFEELLLQHNINEYTNFYSRIHNYLGLINDIGGDKLSAYFHFQTLLHEEDRNSPQINATAYLNIGAIYTFFKDYDQAELLYKKGLAISEISFLEYGWILHRLGELKQRTGQYQESEHYLLKAREHWLKSNDLRSNCFTENVLGELYSKTKSNKEAILFLKEALTKISSEENNLCRIFLLIGIGDNYLAEEQYSLALNYYKKVQLAAKQKEFLRYRITASKQIVEVYLKQKKIEQALINYKEYTKLNEDFYIKDYNQTAVSFQRIKRQLEKEESLRLSQQKETQITEELNIQKVYNKIELSMLIITSLFGGVIYYFYLKQKKSKALLSKLNDKMVEKQLDLEKANAKISKANEEISYHKQELELQLVKKAMMIGKYGDTLNQLEGLVKSESFHSQKNKVLHTLKQLNNSNLTNDLNLQITKANQDFFEKLSLQFSSLTQNELRLCALLKMNFNTKEIANITFKNAQSVKVARSRLRKKLGLTHNKMAISVFLNQL